MHHAGASKCAITMHAVAALPFTLARKRSASAHSPVSTGGLQLDRLTCAAVGAAAAGQEVAWVTSGSQQCAVLLQRAIANALRTASQHSLYSSKRPASCLPPCPDSSPQG